jgi:DNA-binding response OmpR family regulator
MPPVKNQLLLVGDQHAVRAVLRVELQRAGFEVTAGDGPEARRLLDQQAFNIAVLDLVSPQAEGPDLMRHVQSRRVPVVVFAEPEVATTMRGADGYAGKGLDLAHLVAEVRRVLSRPTAKA